MKELGVDVITLEPGVVCTEMNEGLRSNGMDSLPRHGRRPVRGRGIASAL